VTAAPNASVAPAQQNAAANVTIDNFTFSPKVLTVPKGTVVQWINHDDIPHVIASADKKFKKSPPLDTDQSFSHTFSESGTYEYFCAIHSTMTGTVIVK
jgi:plastocyanin